MPSPALDPESLDLSEELTLAGRRQSSGSLTPDGRLRSGRLAGLTMGAAIWALSWPILGESFLNSLVGLTDTVLSAQLSAAATDAIGGASYVLWFVGLVAMAIGVGATALISRAVGAGRMAVANAATGQSLILAAAFGVLVGGGLWLSAAPMSAVLSLRGEAAASFIQYMRIIAFGSPAMMVLSSGIACSRGAGDTVRPLWAMIVVNVVNMAMSWVLSGVDISTTSWVGGEPVTRLMLKNPFGFHWGVSGIAWGTVAGEYVGAAVVVLMLSRGWTGVQLMRRRLRPHWHTLRRLVRVGVPNFLETFGMWAGNFLIILMVGWLGPSGARGADAAGDGLLGSHIVAIRIESFSFLPGFAMGVAAATLAGQYLGAGSAATARRAVLRCAWITAAIMGVVGLGFILVPRTITGWVTSQPSHLEITPRLLMIAGFVQIPFGIGIVFRSALRGAGDVRWVMWLTWISTYGVRIPLAFVLSGADVWVRRGDQFAEVLRNPVGLEPSLAMLWVALCIEIVVRGVLFTARFLNDGWTKARV